jgi:hypothetical protein
LNTGHTKNETVQISLSVGQEAASSDYDDQQVTRTIRNTTHDAQPAALQAGCRCRCSLQPQPAQLLLPAESSSNIIAAAEPPLASLG